MIITKKIVADKILKYLDRKITLTQLVDWSENIFMEGEIESKNFDLIKDILSRLALADVKAFALMNNDCVEFLKKLGYKKNYKAKVM